MERFWEIIRWLVSFVNAISCIILICIICPRVIQHENLSFDYLGVIVGILSLLVTVLLAWNIWTTIELKKEVDTAKQRIDDSIREIKKKEEEFNNQTQQLHKDFYAFKYYGYAITDFCQVYAKLEPEKKDYFGTYCKTLNALRNFLKTNEALDWYAPSCIINMREALKKAIEINEVCSKEMDKTLNEYTDEIRTCTLAGFSKYWKEIDEIEKERRSHNAT